MSTFSRALRRRDPLRIAAAALGLAVLILVAAYGFAVWESNDATAASVVAALAAVAIATSALLYAWRGPARPEQ